MDTRWLDELLAAKGLSRETLAHGVVTEEHRRKIALDIGATYEILAIFIGVPHQDVDDIKDMYSQPVDRRLAMMRRWHQLYGSDATYLKLINGLKQVGRRDLIESLVNQLHTKFNVGVTTCIGRVIKTVIDRLENCHDILFAMSVIFFVMMSSIDNERLPLPSMWRGSNEIVTITNLQTSNQESSSYMCIQPGSSVQLQGATRCGLVEMDLPKVDSEIFVGRENDTRTVVGMMASAYIANINGAPGIGKSALAIHVGYEMITNGTSVRYIDMDDKFSSFNRENVSPYYNEQGRRATIQNPGPMESKKTNLLTHHSTPLLCLGEPTTHVKIRNFVRELKKWSSGIRSPTVLILDNCDDILASPYRDKFLRLIYSVISRSQLNLRVIVVSTEKLVLLDYNFKHWMVANLSMPNAVNFLDQLVTPAVDNSYLVEIAELVEGNPLALKIIGKLLDLHGEYLINEIKKQLNQNPLNVLDKSSIQKEKFRSVLGTAFARLGELKDCGYSLGLFPGSFDEKAGKHVISEECFEVYKRYSLLDEYRLAYHYRYKMHRLIREYVKENLSENDKIGFNKKFGEHYQQFLLEYAVKNTDNGYSLSIETHNFDLLKVLILQDKQKSEKQLAVLAFLAIENYLKLDRLHQYLHMYMDKLTDICHYLSPGTCVEFYLYVIEHTYKYCTKCETLAKYANNFLRLQFACEIVFKCTMVDQIASMCNIDARYGELCTRLPPQEKAFVDLLAETCHCRSYIELKWNHFVRINSTVSVAAFVTQFLVTLSTGARLWNLILFMLLDFPVVYLSFSVIYHTFDVVYVLHLFIKSSISDPLLVQTVSRKICTGMTAVLIWCLLLTCTLKIQYKTKKELTFINVIFCLVTCTLGSITILIICNIQLFVCQFLPICI